MKFGREISQHLMNLKLYVRNHLSMPECFKTRQFWKSMTIFMYLARISSNL